MNNQNTKKDSKEQEIIENEKVTITPTMLDDSEDRLEKRGIFLRLYLSLKIIQMITLQ